jgi:hypothetical protein
VWGFSPLDEELGLIAGGLTPRLDESLQRLGAWMPFRRAAQLLADLTGALVSEATARRHTLAGGAAYEQVQSVEAERVQSELPAPPQGPERQFLSADGAFVPVVGREWTEVKTLTIGTVAEDARSHEPQVEQLSYFSRVAEAQRFGELALGEIHRRGVETAGACCAPTDGAEWIQGLLDLHRPDAVRILDFPHAAQRVAQSAALYFGEGSAGAAEFADRHLHALKHEGPQGVLEALGALAREHPEQYMLAENLGYLRRREASMDYPAYRRAGWPIGSGPSESANKVVVEARLKGAGMHWAREHLNPMLALRNAVCNDRWEEACLQTCQYRRQQRLAARAQMAQSRSGQPVPPQQPGPAVACPVPMAAVAATPTASPVAPSAHEHAVVHRADTPKPPVTRKPAANHPWRHSPIGKARFTHTAAHTGARN